MRKQIRSLGENIGNGELVILANLNAKCFIKFCWQIPFPPVWLSGSSAYQLCDLEEFRLSDSQISHM